MRRDYRRTLQNIGIVLCSGILFFMMCARSTPITHPTVWSAIRDDLILLVVIAVNVAILYLFAIFAVRVWRIVAYHYRKIQTGGRERRL